MQCLAKDPASRPANATELLHRLDAVASPSGSGCRDAGDPHRRARDALARTGDLRRGVRDRRDCRARGDHRDRPSRLGLPWRARRHGARPPGDPLHGVHPVRRAPRGDATPTFTPGGTQSPAARGTMATLAIKASPHVSWQRTVRGGMIAVGVFVLLVAGFMTLRALGIGPAGRCSPPASSRRATRCSSPRSTRPAPTRRSARRSARRCGRTWRRAGPCT